MTESDSSYNVWTNYETWVVNLWLTNDEVTYGICRSLAEKCLVESLADTVFSRKERACYNLSNELKDMLVEGDPLGSQASVYSDLPNAAISEVNWQEIADHFMEEFEE